MRPRSCFLIAGLSIHAAQAEEVVLSAWGDTYDAPREVRVDVGVFTGTSDPVQVTYDLHAATRSVRHLSDPAMPDWVHGVRLVLSEVGSHRLVDGQYGVLEALGILQTVQNRRDPKVWNPQDVPGARPWPGCGADSTFRSCANPTQYLGLKQRRALRPTSTVTEPDRLAQAVDIIVAAWWLSHHAAVPDVTRGGTSFVHRCGGRAYGKRTIFCDGNDATPDVAGADRRTGPLAFKGPGTWQADRGFYTLVTKSTIDWKPREGRVQAGAFGAMFSDAPRRNADTTSGTAAP